MTDENGEPEAQAERKPKLNPREALGGFIDSNPVFKHVGKEGVPKFYARVGVNHFRRSENGIPVKAGTTYHHLVAFREAAEAANDRLARGDHFIALGYVHEYQNRQGTPDEEFIAMRIGHDAVETDYAVFRDINQQPSRRKPPAVDRTQAFTPPNRATPAREPESLSR